MRQRRWPGVFEVREWLATFLATSLIVYEAVIEHSAHREVYGVALVLFGFVPFSLVDRMLGRWADDAPRRTPPPSRRRRRDDR